jgi:hypothetical protein
MRTTLAPWWDSGKLDAALSPRPVMLVPDTVTDAVPVLVIATMPEVTGDGRDSVTVPDPVTSTAVPLATVAVTLVATCVNATGTHTDPVYTNVVPLSTYVSPATSPLDGRDDDPLPVLGAVSRLSARLWRSLATSGTSLSSG